MHVNDMPSARTLKRALLTPEEQLIIWQIPEITGNYWHHNATWPYQRVHQSCPDRVLRKI
jgi:hypothetical protein